MVTERVISTYWATLSFRICMVINWKARVAELKKMNHVYVSNATCPTTCRSNLDPNQCISLHCIKHVMMAGQCCGSVTLLLLLWKIDKALDKLGRDSTTINIMEHEMRELCDNAQQQMKKEMYRTTTKRDRHKKYCITVTGKIIVVRWTTGLSMESNYVDWSEKMHSVMSFWTTRGRLRAGKFDGEKRSEEKWKQNTRKP